jgi:hypothetical protein
VNSGWACLPAGPLLGPADPVRPELRRTADGRRVLLAYSSLAELVGGCGAHQPWVLVPAGWLERIAAECRTDAVAVNAVLPPHWRHEEESWPGKPEEWND